MLEKSIIMEKISCFICGENEKNSTILSKDTFNVVECACGFKFINPRPDPKEISKFYNLDTYHPHQKGSGLIYSGLYNSTSSVNNINEFNMSQKITKDLNPSYGSIQALKTRDTDVVVLTEDKVLKVLS